MRLKDIREDADVAQKTVADVLNIKQNTYSQYETGKRQLPLNALVELALYFGVSTDYILELTDDPTPHARGIKYKK